MLGASTASWLEAADGMSALASEDAFHQHISELVKLTAEDSAGILPAGQVDLLVDVALGSPAVCALRALHR
ncbi:hypothetical protein, partial [Rhodohalobacter sp. 8-1]